MSGARSKENDPMRQFVLKQPDDEDAPELLYKSGYIRRMVDVVPPPSDVEPQTMVLEAFEKSLWSARSIAIGLGLYTTRISFIQVCCRERDLTLNRHSVPDLKMENVLVNGFDNKSPGSGERLVTKIANLGTGMLSLHGCPARCCEWPTKDQLGRPLKAHPYPQSLTIVLRCTSTNPEQLQQIYGPGA
ncbi:hypothetical protein RJZ56_005527 [Blastomyces dermatitidis]